VAETAVGPVAGHELDDGRRSKADRVYLAVKRGIVRGSLPPGAAIDKAALCARFGASRLPVTTALQRLAYEGLIRIEPQKGSYVARIRLSDVLQWMTARRALEAELAGEAARRLGDEALEAMRRSLHYQEAAVEADDHDGFLQLDVGFHRVLPDGLGMPRVGELLDGLRPHLDRVRRLLLPEPGRMVTTLAEHRAIHAAIAGRSPAAASRTMRRHIDAVIERLTGFERRHPDFFGP
jgi:DNA-binding GntR family transcriptional regulator